MHGITHQNIGMSQENHAGQMREICLNEEVVVACRNGSLKLHLSAQQITSVLEVVPSAKPESKGAVEQKHVDED